jgi:hypothetical protein
VLERNHDKTRKYLHLKKKKMIEKIIEKMIEKMKEKKHSHTHEERRRRKKRLGLQIYIFKTHSITVGK